VNEELAGQWLDQSARQLAAAGSRRVRWYFAEPEAEEFARQSSKRPGAAGERKMNENPFRFRIYYEVPRRGETPAVIGAKLPQTLDALSRIDPLLAEWKVLDRPTQTSVPLADARSRIATIVENFAARDDNDQPAPKWGYWATGVTNAAMPSRVVELLQGWRIVQGRDGAGGRRYSSPYRSAGREI
jgi:hypothetical protein